MKANILVVDDTPAALTLLNDILTAADYDVRPFNNGELALRSALAEMPEVVLLDIRMPGLNGFEVCRRLKENDALADIPVIFISAADELEDKVRGFQAGGVDYITKPFQKEEVIARVHTHVELHRSRRELKKTAEALRRSEESLKIAQSIARLGHWEWDVASGEVRWSDETFRILGYERGDIAPTHDALLKVVHPGDREAVRKSIEQTRAGGSFDIEHRIVLPDGRVRAVHSVGKVVCLGDGEPPRVVATIQDVTEHERRELLGVIQDITERKEMEQKLEAEARTDSLTGTAMRRYFLDLARREMTRVGRYGGRLSLLMLDLDHFKNINDRYGHGVGDLTLQALARVCRETLREDDVVGRVGGEEFAVLMPETGSDMAAEVGDRLRQAIAAAQVPIGGASPLMFTASIGVATLTPADVTVEALMERADRALYAAKNAGRNVVRVAASDGAGTMVG